ncbi:ammonium transporter 3 [Biomphalaria glabrata]|nr:ammonium transporter 3 [Biomphalaria glabrata]
MTSLWTSTTMTSNLSVSTQEPKARDDAIWLLTTAFIIFTMQSGFGLLESGCVSSKNEVNIMAKNVADVVFGGMSYWMVGYGLSYGDGEGTNGFCGIGKFFIDPDNENMGEEFSRFVFQSSFATTATTIVSGAIAERTRYLAYMIFSFFNTFVFCIAAHWVWSEHGWLKKMGVVDIAGDGPVHLVGGAVSLIGAIMIKPRAKRFTPQDDHEMGSPSGTLLGLFVLWWGWLAFNCGSTYGISEGKWKLASRAAATTLMAGTAGGIVGSFGSYIAKKKKFLIPWIVNGVLGGLVSITASCAVTGVWEALVIGSSGAVFVLLTNELLIKLRIDDPVSAIPVHFTGGVWGLLATGIFVHKDTITNNFSARPGIVQGGSATLLGVQALAALAISAWAIGVGGLLLKVIDLTVGLRLTPENEEIGADMSEHGIRSFNSAHRIQHLSDLNSLLELVEHGLVPGIRKVSAPSSTDHTSLQTTENSTHKIDGINEQKPKRFRLHGRIWQALQHRVDKYIPHQDQNHNGMPQQRSTTFRKSHQKHRLSGEETRPDAVVSDNLTVENGNNISMISYLNNDMTEDTQAYDL